MSLMEVPVRETLVTEAFGRNRLLRPITGKVLHRNLWRVKPPGVSGAPVKKI